MTDRCYPRDPEARLRAAIAAVRATAARWRLDDEADRPRIRMRAHPDGSWALRAPGDPGWTVHRPGLDRVRLTPEPDGDCLGTGGFGPGWLDVTGEPGPAAQGPAGPEFRRRMADIRSGMRAHRTQDQGQARAGGRDDGRGVGYLDRYGAGTGRDQRDADGAEGGEVSR